MKQKPYRTYLQFSNKDEYSKFQKALKNMGFSNKRQFTKAIEAETVTFVKIK